MAKKNSYTLLVSLLCLPGLLFTWFSQMAFSTMNLTFDTVLHTKRNPSREGKGSLHGGRYLSLFSTTFEGTLHPNSGDSLITRNSNRCAALLARTMFEPGFQILENNLGPRHISFSSALYRIVKLESLATRITTGNMHSIGNQPFHC